MSGALHGKTIVNTRALHQAGAFDDLIRARGAVPLSYPCIAIKPPQDTTELDTTLQQLAQGMFDWLVLTSANTVLILAERLRELRLSLPQGAFRTAAVGPATAEATTTMLGIEAGLIPDEYVAESLAEAILAQPGKRILMPESAIARPTLAQTLTDSGRNVQVVTGYRTLRGEGGVDLPRLLNESKVDVVTFTSSSTVENFLARLSDEAGRQSVEVLMNRVAIGCIGPKTVKTATASGLTVSIMPDNYTLGGLLDAIEQYFLKMRNGIRHAVSGTSNSTN